MFQCPVCKQGMAVTGINPNIYQCQRTKVWVPELGIKLDNIHATYYVEPLTQKITYKVIELGMYSFTIQDGERPEDKSTVIRKVKELKGNRRKARTFESEVVLKFASAIDLPWHDYDKVIERLRLYFLFS